MANKNQHEVKLYDCVQMFGKLDGTGVVTCTVHSNRSHR
jgi:hypothetical protein